MQANYSNIPIFTLHDCIVTTSGNEMLIEQVMKSSIREFLGYSPKTETKYWHKNEELISKYINNINKSLQIRA